MASHNRSPLQVFVVCAFTLAFHTTFAAVVKQDLVISNKIIAPDGYSRSAILAGDTMPGTLIRGNKGDSFEINVINKLSDPSMRKSTSVHWHGIHQKHSNWADGSASVTQCPIGPGDSFMYKFHSYGQAGTFWYHSHLSTQYCDGLRGPLVIYDPKDPHKPLYDVDDESTIITLSDWYHGSAKYALPPGSIPPLADSTLINGLGRDPVSGLGDLAIVNVEYGKRYRFRVIQMACDLDYVFSIDGHPLQVIEADSITTRPVLVDSIKMYAGQRYSVVLNALMPVGNYWIRANPNNRAVKSGFEGGINSAILRYKGAPEEEPRSVPTPNMKPLVETDLHPLFGTNVPGKKMPGKADITLNMTTSITKEVKVTFGPNNSSFTPPELPILLQLMNGADPSSLLPKGSVYPLPRNKVVDIILPSMNQGGPHPFHLHGHDFWVIRSAESDRYNFVDPILRDTVNSGFNNSMTTIRFTTDNPGPWFLHCHIDWHLELGMGVVFAEDPKSSEITDPIPDAWKELCPKYAELPEDDK